MKNGILTSFLLLINHFIFGQTIISGKLINSENENVIFSTIKAVSAIDSITRTVGISDTLGVYSLTMSDDNITSYQITIKHPEYLDTTFTVNVTADQKHLELGNLMLKKNVQLLSEVSISANKKIIERQIDRLIFNVENSVSSQGRTLMDLLVKTPLVLVQNRNVSVIGKGNVFILINDRMLYLTGEELANFLESIPSEDVQRIEVITNPPAKYDAAGGSLINIVTKKSKLSGTNGNITSAYTQAYYPTIRLGGSINHRTKNFNIYGSLYGRDGNNKFIERTDYYYTTINSHQQETIFMETKNIRPSIGFDYYTKNSTLSMTHENIESQRLITSNASFDFKNESNESDSVQQIISKNTNTTIYNSSNLNYLINLDTLGKTINFNLNYLTNNNKVDNHFNSFTEIQTLQGPGSHIKSLSDQRIKIASFNIDYELPLKFMDLSFGTKIYWIHNRNNNSMHRTIADVVQNDSLQNQQLVYNEVTEAAYISAYKTYKKMQCQLGFRIENTQLNGHVPNSDLYKVNRNFLNLFPTAYLLYQINEKSTISASYSKRIDRPNYYALNPIKRYLTPYIYRQGNPLLRPTFMQEAELNYTFPNSFIVGLLYTNFNNSYMEIPTQTEGSGFAYLQNNIGNTNQYGGVVNLPFAMKSWMESSVIVVCIHSVFTPNIPAYSRSETTILFGNINSTYYIGKNKKVSGDISLVMRPFGSIYTLSSMDSQYILNLGWKVKILKNMGALTLTINDVFMNEVPKSSVSSNTFRLETNNYYDTRSFVVSFSYRFGNNFLKNRMYRDKGNEAEDNRIQ